MIKNESRSRRRKQGVRHDIERVPMTFPAWITAVLWWIGAIIVDVFESCVFLYEVIWKAREDSSRIYRCLRWVGYALLALALALCIADWGWDLGSVAWLGYVAAATLVVALVPMPLSRWSLCVIPHAMVLMMAGISALIG